ncbi:hypothetical protein SELMODRAFT_412352 [Selaginella moellendorffii]|uniref:Uncharacterized protein n=1 Tax=Selaginella moellendorffii TaxID=88036 RepID=D8RKV9_SELML|nr:probable F-box protein At4g22030 [Selaginella moellendorffii]EFJ27514.1 hypothetical protein SELMODRAFT_412352 [Selaginella moellendorffii]|eukprot:XP_002971765.1 probable F-box protein At4g22030 [Selaginella moellendorffii]
MAMSSQINISAQAMGMKAVGGGESYGFSPLSRIKTPPQSAVSTGPSQVCSSAKINAVKLSPAVERVQPAADVFKGWLDESAMLENQKLLAKLRILQASISDRKEMHSIIAQQRDDWNKLFQGSLRLATVTAGVLSALNGSSIHGLSLALSAGLLDVFAALVMAAVNKFQPSQLAEEQRTAARQFANLFQEIDSTLAISPSLREDSRLFFQDRISKFHALDQAYPLPLTPGGLPKFPEKISPSPSGTSYDPSAPIIRVASETSSSNGWSRKIEEDLLRVSSLLDKDVENYLKMCRIILSVNKGLAIAGPAMALLAGIANLANSHPIPASLLSIGAFFAGCVSHDMQLGMIFEMYRGCAGYYTDVQDTIQRTLRMPVELREDGELFHQKVVHRLGRKDELPSIPRGAATAGIIF